MAEAACAPLNAMFPAATGHEHRPAAGKLILEPPMRDLLVKQDALAWAWQALSLRNAREGAGQRTDQAASKLASPGALTTFSVTFPVLRIPRL